MQIFGNGSRGTGLKFQRNSSGVSMLSSFILVALFLQLCSAAAVVPRQNGGMKVMIVGDSITCGLDGDITWRYYIWQWFRDNGVAATFVGPRSGTKAGEIKTPQPPPLAGESSGPAVHNFNGGYDSSCDSAFTSTVKHLSQWGLQVQQAKGFIRQNVATYMPDMILVELGFNDLGFYVTGAQGTLQSMKNFVDEARAANPNVKMVIANVPQRKYLGFGDLPQKSADYNNMLVDEVPKWSTQQSPIYVADFAGQYSCNTRDCAAGYDGLHPNKLGNAQIAKAFSIALNKGHKLGNAAFNIPGSTAEATPPAPGGIQQVAWDGGIRVEWTKTPGARYYEVEECFSGSCSVSNTDMNAMFVQWVYEGMQKQIRVRAVKSELQNIRSDWSAQVTATAHPKTAPGPKNIKVYAQGTSFRVTWDAPDGVSADRYSLITWDSGTPSSFFDGMAVGGGERTLTFKTSNPNHKYFVALVTWTGSGDNRIGGLPAIGRWVIPTGGTPGTPQNPQIITYNNGASIRMRVSADGGAAGYSYAIRKVPANGKRDLNAPDGEAAGESDGPCWATHFLFPGAWNYQFRVSANNGNANSSWSNWITAPVTSTEGDAECPPGPSYQPGGSGAGAPDTPVSKSPTYDYGSSGGSTTNPGTSPNPSGAPIVSKQRETCTKYGLTLQQQWQQSGAPMYLDDIINNLSNGNKLTEKTPLDKWVESYVSGQDVALSQTSCGVIGGRCEPHSRDCTSYDKPVYWFIQTAFSNLNTAIKVLNQNFQKETVINALSVSDILDKFQQIHDKSPAGNDGLDGLGATMASAFGIVGAALGAIPVAGTAAGAAGLSIFSGLGALIFQPQPTEWEIRSQNAEAIRKYLGDTLAGFTDQLKSFLAKAFLNGDLGQGPVSSGESTQLARFLHEGDFLSALSIDGNASNNLRTFIQHGIVGAIMKKSLVVEWIGVRSASICNSYKGARTIKGVCHTLEYLQLPKPEDNGIPPYAPLPSDVFTQLDNIGLDVEKLMLNAKQCRNKYPDVNQRQPKWVPANGAEYQGYPECFFPLVIVGDKNGNAVN